NDCFVFLFVLVEKLRESRRLAYQQHKHTGRKRVERSSMSNAFCFQNAADAGHDVMRGQAFRFIDDEQTIHLACMLLVYQCGKSGSGRPTRSSVTFATLSVLARGR